MVEHENHNPTGAFKVRGGLTYVDALKRRAPRRPALVSATRGNHGQSLAFAARRAGLAAISSSRMAIRQRRTPRCARSAPIVEHGEDFQAAKEASMRFAEARGCELVPSFHRDLVRGVATWSLELFRAHPDLDAFTSPRPGLGDLRRRWRRATRWGWKTEIVGVQAEGAPAYALLFRRAPPRDDAPGADTRADGMATRIPDAEALEIIWKGAASVVSGFGR